ncbi:probable beta-hexosaminidase fdl isoform X2 [Drosophila hydei]|nr:probable beta-hexosaminidase fdl isoform X2 [Drosophila hydei]XP_023161572.1 probable beta-hexosaminidase fdl isoform X2 [Drosophila hydei]XP_023161573.1 probable beta-hexosaminidase fdl isoform X2 [Drosophila hydei]
MSLAVSLRRALLLLLSGAIFILTVLYWNQGVIKTQSYNEAQLRPHIQKDHSSILIPLEKSWTYKCDNDRCVRVNYHRNGANVKRVSFISCSMTCGDINIWPHPTSKSQVSSHTLRFSVEDLQLRLDTPHHDVRRRLKLAFDVLVRQLRQIQRLEYASPHAEAMASASEPSAKSTDAAESPLAGGLFSSTFGSHRSGDLDSLHVKLSVHESDELNFNLDNDESYELVTSLDHRRLIVHIRAKTFFGARHGLSTLQQLIWYDDEERLLRTYASSVVNDAPKFRYRGLMLDTSRHFFSVDAIKRTISAMGLAKLNRFHWHITDAQSFPYISRHYPELAEHGAYSDSETYSEQDVREVNEYAKIFGVQVLLEIDAPAHAGNGWDWGPKRGLGELSLCINQQPWSFYCGEPPCGQLNPKNNHTYLILQRLYEEFLQLTGPTDIFHLGGDEVNLDCWAQYFNDTDLRGLWCDFMLQSNARLKVANGNVAPKHVVVWSSALTNTKCLPNSQFVVQVWGGSTWQENYDLLDNGYNIIFSHVDAWYLDCGFGSWRATGEAACSPYRTWQNVYKHRPWERMRLDKKRRKQVLGGEACLWTEQVDEGQLDNRLWPRVAALAERLWSDPNDDHDFDIVPPEVFRRISVFRNRLVELGIKAEALFPKYCAQNPGECI